ncbi:MAG: hypothetical protein L3K10_07355 [Thermoplasmata archaeon]|nr:hypothetical protein [Thermoplasmata archaeon]
MTPVITEAQADRLARNVLLSRLQLKPKENVTIEAYPSALPWATGFVREARRRGAHALLHFEDENSYWSAVDEGRAGLLGAAAPHEMAALAETDVYIYFWGPENLARRWKLTDSQQDKATAFNDHWYEVARKEGVRGARMGIARVTPENARTFGVPYGTWLSEMYAASTRDLKPLVRDADRLRKVLEKGHSVRIRHSNGTDLEVALAGRPMREGLGRVTPVERKTRFGMMTSVPEAVVYVALDEDSAEGTFVANRPSRLGSSQREGGRWTMKDARLAKYTYTSGGKEFQEAFKDAGPGRDRPALLEIGLDADVRVSPLMEESERGAVSFGVGGNGGYGGKTKIPFLEWLTVAGAELSVDGRTITRSGKVV